MLKKTFNCPVILDKSFEDPSVRWSCDFLRKNVEHIKKLEQTKKEEREAQQTKKKQMSYLRNGGIPKNFKQSDTKIKLGKVVAATVYKAKVPDKRVEPNEEGVNNEKSKPPRVPKSYGASNVQDEDSAQKLLAVDTATINPPLGSESPEPLSERLEGLASSLPSYDTVKSNSSEVTDQNDYNANGFVFQADQIKEFTTRFNGFQNNQLPTVIKNIANGDISDNNDTLQITEIRKICDNSHHNPNNVTYCDLPDFDNSSNGPDDDQITVVGVDESRSYSDISFYELNEGGVHFSESDDVILASKHFQNWITNLAESGQVFSLEQPQSSKEMKIGKTVEQLTMQEVLNIYRDRQPKRSSFGLTQSLPDKFYENIPLTNDEPSMAEIIQQSKSRTKISKDNTEPQAKEGLSFVECLENARRPLPPTRRSTHFISKHRESKPGEKTSVKPDHCPYFRYKNSVSLVSQVSKISEEDETLTPRPVLKNDDDELYNEYTIKTFKSVGTNTPIVKFVTTSKKKSPNGGTYLQLSNSNDVSEYDDYIKEVGIFGAYGNNGDGYSKNPRAPRKYLTLRAHAPVYDTDSTSASYTSVEETQEQLRKHRIQIKKRKTVHSRKLVDKMTMTSKAGGSSDEEIHIKLPRGLPNDPETRAKYIKYLRRVRAQILASDSDCTEITPRPYRQPESDASSLSLSDF